VSIQTKIINSVLDLYKGGPLFWFGGISSKFSHSKTIAVQLPSGGRVSVRPGQSDFSVLRQIFRDQGYSIPTVVAARIDREYRRIRANRMTPVIVDAGANIGASSIWLKERFPEAAVVAIEPDPANAALARQNVAGLQDVTVIEAAIGGQTGFVSIISADAAWALRTERAETGYPVITVDQAVSAIISGKLLIAKIDIEGFEHDLFEGDLRWMDDAFAIYIEPHDWLLPGHGSSRSFQSAFGERDFEVFICGENLLYVRRDLEERQASSGASLIHAAPAT
jgi:FkbM family methyltransferase